MKRILLSIEVLGCATGGVNYTAPVVPVRVPNSTGGVRDVDRRNVHQHNRYGLGDRARE